MENQLFKDSHFKLDFLTSKFQGKFQNSCKIYCSIRDGAELSNFIRLCLDKPHTVTVIKSKDNGHLIGGYASKAFNQEHITDTDAFIFSVSRQEVYPI